MSWISTYMSWISTDASKKSSDTSRISVLIFRRLIWVEIQPILVQISTNVETAMSDISETNHRIKEITVKKSDYLF